MPAATLIYDEDCGFCRWCLGKVLSWDRRGQIRPLPLGSGAADRMLTEVPVEERAASWHLVDGAGTVHSAGAGFPVLLRLLPGGRPLATAAAAAPGLTDRGYRLVAGNRSRLGRLVSEGAKARADRRIAQRG
jgi:predicted DCC family thiol-disulfide oxidoreductase YuxK